MPPATSAWMRIGEISRRTGVNPDVLRAWERRYRLLRPRRTAGGTRLYSATDETRVRLMQRYIADGLPPAQAAEMVTAVRLTVRPGQAASVPPAEIAAAHAEMHASLDRFDETSAHRGLGPRALLACAPDEQHTFGLIAFGVALHHFGWRITYLGANTGVAMIEEAATHVEPDLVVVAAALPERLAPILDE